MNQMKVGSVVNRLRLRSILSEEVSIPDSAAIVHLQFRRFAGCPVCDLHLRSVASRHGELLSASIREVVVFHSSIDELHRFCMALPFDVIADPEKRLYAQFGVGSSPRALLAPSVWGSIIKGIFRSSVQALRRRTPLPSMNPPGGRFGLPADFLIAPTGVILACKYGSHAYDQWSVDETLNAVRSTRTEIGPFSDSCWRQLNRHVNSILQERFPRSENVSPPAARDWALPHHDRLINLAGVDRARHMETSYGDNLE